ncbi:MAG TPA: tRNA (adenosine(37)-N6)-threonylcarbamoyltransferase complex ATPase subunit type 1 TsaE [Crinalium sp.]|jgi:tRNA threonylcarbamoyladenosine biosynthesis protein TsaE
MVESAIIVALTDAAATYELGSALGRSLPAGSTLLLEGDLGSGKTTLVQAIGAGLGIVDAIASPTFTLINEYPEGRIPLYHFDLYRLEPANVAGLQPELYWEGVEVDPGIVAIEWAERLPYRPSSYLQISLTLLPDGSRQAIFKPVGQGEWALPTLT